MSIVVLSAGHFSRSGRTLKLNLPGNVIVYFKAVGCRGCMVMDPMFAALAREFTPRGVNFGAYTISASGGDRVIASSGGSTTPVTHTPRLYFYIDGFPKSMYTGEASMAQLREFVHQKLGGAGSGGRPTPMPSAARPSSRMPEIDRPSSIPILGGSGKGGEPTFDEDEDVQLAIPEGVIPKDRPWLCATGI